MTHIRAPRGIHKACEAAARAAKRSPDLTAGVWYSKRHDCLIVVHRGYQSNVMQGFEPLGEFRADASIKSITDALKEALRELQARGFDLSDMDPNPDVYDYI